MTSGDGEGELLLGKYRFLDEAIAQRVLLAIQRDAIAAKVNGYWEEVAQFDWCLGEREAAK